MRVLIQFYEMEKANVALAEDAIAKETGIEIKGRLTLTPVIFAEATMEQIAVLAKNPNIRKITFDGVMHALEFAGTEAFPELNPEFWISVQDSLPIIRAPEAWADGWRGQGMKMAVCDTGIWESHPWLVGKTIARWTAYGGNPAMPTQPHGTHVAGICSSVAPDAKLLNIQVLDSNGSGAFSTILLGMEAAVNDLGANVVNLSLGASTRICFTGDPFDAELIALSEKAVLCIAAGNLGQQGIRTIDYPGSSIAAVCCGACDKSKVVAYFSGRGPSGCNEVKPDALAPGVSITSSVPPDGTASWNGTSMATPFFTGMFACVLGKKGSNIKRSNGDIEKLLSDSIPHSAKNNNYGYGIIDVKAACDWIQTAPPPPPPIPSPQASATHYTTYPLVRKRVAQISSSLTNDDIETFIREAEGILDSIMKENFREIFNRATHGLIRETCEAMAAYSALTYDVTQFAANPQAALEADLLNNIIERNVELLKDERIVKAIKNFKHLNPPTTTYADYSLVRKRIAKISTALTNADITEFIFQAEGIIDAIMKKSFRNNTNNSIFRPAKHGLIQETCEAMAAYSCINYDVTFFSSVSQAALAANLIWKMIERNVELLKDERIVRQMEAL